MTRHKMKRIQSKLYRIGTYNVKTRNNFSTKSCLF